VDLTTVRRGGKTALRERLAGVVDGEKMAKNITRT
jgi:hypothetical protein